MQHRGWRVWVRRVGWLATYWLAGVLCLALVAALLKLFMRAAGLSG
jgi:hypothetical protein